MDQLLPSTMMRGGILNLARQQNLLLSLLAAIQAPIIMMSQNRQEDRDRMRAENDYQVNLKSEVEIHPIGEKPDYQDNR